MAAYPDALFILNKRDPDKWLVSMQNTLFHVFSWSSWPLLARLDPGMAGKWYAHCMLTWSIFCSNDYGSHCRQKYVEHYGNVRNIVPNGRLLEYEVKEGWEPLCRFLGKGVPKSKFPNVNDTENWVKLHKLLWRYAVFNAVKNVGCGMMGVSVVGIAWYMYRNR